jgi:ABC-type multidrug transport system fused ATPase/permease subunit
MKRNKSLISAVVIETLGMLCIVTGYFLKIAFAKYLLSDILFYVGIACALPMIFYILTRPIAFLLPKSEIKETNNVYRPNRFADTALNIGILFEVIGLICVVAALAVYLIFSGNMANIHWILLYIGVGCAIPALIYIIIYVTVRRYRWSQERKHAIENLNKAVSDLEAERATLSDVRAKLDEYDTMIEKQKNSFAIDKDELDKLLAEKATFEARLAEREQIERSRILLAVDTRQKNAEARKAIFSQENLDNLITTYFVPLSACFLMNRDTFMDNYGIAPYNKVATNSTESGNKLFVLSMSRSETSIYKFAEFLEDTKRFVAHKNLYPLYLDLRTQKVSLVRMSQQIQKVLLRDYRADFIKDYKKKEDFDNLLILVTNYTVTKDIDFKSIFKNIPFNIADFDRAQVANYLAEKELRDSFEAVFPGYKALGYPNLSHAMYACLADTIKNKRDIQFLLDAITKDAKGVSKLIKTK